MLPDIVDVLEPTDTFLSKRNLIERAIDEYTRHKKFTVAFDMDDTVIQKNGEGCEQVCELLRVCSGIPSMNMIVYTARQPDEYDRTIAQLDRLNIRYNAINENIDRSYNKGNKIFYNVFLCDRAGLPTAYEVLVAVVHWYYYGGGKDIVEDQEGGD